jgi:hypothetical protein
VGDSDGHFAQYQLLTPVGSVCVVILINVVLGLAIYVLRHPVHELLPFTLAFYVYLSGR